MKITKKAQEGNPLFGTIKFAIVLLALLAFLWVILPLLTNQMSGGLCKLTAATMANSKFFGIESPIIKDLKCNTQYLKIKNDGIFLYDNGNYKKDSINYKSFNQYPEYYGQKVVADQMHQCWNYMGQGNIDPFGNYDDSAKCMVCSQIEFDPEYSAKYPKFDDFGKFLDQNYVKDDSGAQISYYDYLTGGARDETGQIPKFQLDTDPQSVIFISIKPNKAWDVGGWGGASIISLRGCDTVKDITKALGWGIGKIPGIGTKIKGLSWGMKISNGAGKTFSFACQGSLLRNGKLVQKAAFWGGTAQTFRTATGEEEPRVLLVTIVPTEEVGKFCDKMYG